MQLLLYLQGSIICLIGHSGSSACVHDPGLESHSEQQIEWPIKSGLTIVWGSRHSEDGILQSAAGVSSWSLV